MACLMASEPRHVWERYKADEADEVHSPLTEPSCFWVLVFTAIGSLDEEMRYTYEESRGGPSRYACRVPSSRPQNHATHKIANHRHTTNFF